MLAGEMAGIAEGGEQPFRCRGAARLRRQREIVGHRALGRIVERHHALFVAFAAHDDHPRIAARGRGGKRHQLGDAQAGGVKKLDQTGKPRRAQPHRERRLRIARTRRRQQAIDLGERQRLRQRTRALWPLEHGGRIVLALPFRIKKTVELANGRQAPRNRCRLHAARSEIAQIGADVVGRRGRDRSPAGEVIGEVGEVAPISGERVFARPAFRRQHVEKERDQPFVGLF